MATVSLAKDPTPILINQVLRELRDDHARSNRALRIVIGATTIHYVKAETPRFDWHATWWTRGGWKTSGTFRNLTRDELEKSIADSGGTLIDYTVI
jgi:hypothetical protein